MKKWHIYVVCYPLNTKVSRLATGSGHKNEADLSRSAAPPSWAVVGGLMEFSTGEIITAATGKLCCPMDRVYAILNFLTGDNLFTHQLPRAFRACQAHVQEQCSWTKELDESRCTSETWEAFLSDAEKKYGTKHNLFPLPSGLWTAKDPIQEAEEMIGPERVIVVHA